MAKTKVQWSCRECGHTQSRWTGSCGGCGIWNGLMEEIAREERKERYGSSKGAIPIWIGAVKQGETTRIETGLVEVDRLFGGGITVGSLTLIGGEPGVGKSTLLLQISNQIALSGKKVLYVCGEESVEQTFLRAHRLSIAPPELYLLSETSFEAIQTHIQNLRPDFLVIDSIQILYKETIPSSPGSVVQVREITTEFMHIAKKEGITCFLIGHVTKSGEIAGPRVLEHLVDTVLEFEGDRHHGYRLLRSMKNRFGPTDEMAMFQMDEGGLSEVLHPSKIFLEERKEGALGSAIVAGLEGARSFLLEIQALVTPTSFPNPSRRSTGLDPNRLALLLAVLEKRVGYRLYQFDVFVAIAGGMKVVEPAIDLGVVLALASSFTNRSIPSSLIAIGEVGLGGEVRGVRRLEPRLKEAIHMGFSECILPRKSWESLPPSLRGEIRCIPVTLVEEAIERLFG